MLLMSGVEVGSSMGGGAAAAVCAGRGGGAVEACRIDARAGVTSRELDFHWDGRIKADMGFVRWGVREVCRDGEESCESLVSKGLARSEGTAHTWRHCGRYERRQWPRASCTPLLGIIVEVNEHISRALHGRLFEIRASVVLH